MIEKRGIIPIIALSSALSLTACSAHDLSRGGEATGHTADSHPGVESHAETSSSNAPILDLTKKQGLSSIMPLLARDRVVFVGETHDNFGHHLNQLEVIRQLHRRNPDIAIGMEFFQQLFQPALYDYIGGRSSEREMLLRTEWYQRWRYDYRLYRPIMEYARRHGIPVVALNVARELTDRVSEVGFDGLNDEERARIPQQIDTSDTGYRERIRSVYQSHPHSPGSSFERFLEVQLTWDEGMADRVAHYLQRHADRNMVVLAGSGHLMYGSGIPDRVQRRVPVASHVLLPADNIPLNPDIADFLVYPERVELPQAGMMGVMLDKGDKGVLISGVVPESAADQAGIEKGDLILRLNGDAVGNVADVKIGMLDKSPGDKVELQLLRKKVVWGERTLQLELELGGDR